MSPGGLLWVCLQNKLFSPPQVMYSIDQRNHSFLPCIEIITNTSLDFNENSSYYFITAKLFLNVTIWTSFFFSFYFKQQYRALTPFSYATVLRLIVTLQLVRYFSNVSAPTISLTTNPSREQVAVNVTWNRGDYGQLFIFLWIMLNEIQNLNQIMEKQTVETKNCPRGSCVLVCCSWEKEWGMYRNTARC